MQKVCQKLQRIWSFVPGAQAFTNTLYRSSFAGLQAKQADRPNTARLGWTPTLYGHRASFVACARLRVLGENDEFVLELKQISSFDYLVACLQAMTSRCAVP